MVEFLNFTLEGISAGMIYAAIALSLVLIWRGTRVLNYSQGAMAMLTSFIALEVVYATGNYWLAFVVALASGLALGAVVERLVVRQVTGKPPLNAVIVTIGLLIGIEGLAGLFFGGNDRSFPEPYSPNGLSVGTVALGITRNDIFIGIAVLTAAGLFAVVFQYTSIGLRLRALAGMLVSPSTLLSPNSMDAIFVLGFTAAVIGGLESPVGAVVGGLILGVVLSYAGGYLGSATVNLFGLAALLVVLMLRPAGLFSAAQARRV